MDSPSGNVSNGRGMPSVPTRSLGDDALVPVLRCDGCAGSGTSPVCSHFQKGQLCDIELHSRHYKEILRLQEKVPNSDDAVNHSVYEALLTYHTTAFEQERISRDATFMGAPVKVAASVITGLRSRMIDLVNVVAMLQKLGLLDKPKDDHRDNVDIAEVTQQVRTTVGELLALGVSRGDLIPSENQDAN